MSRSTDAGHFFQTTSALATTERKAAKSKNKHGNPIKLPSKILAACDDGSGSGVYVAEAAGEVKRMNLDTGKIDRIFSQSTAPLTCLAVGPNKTVYTGSWDRNIYAINPDGTSKTLKGHTDFVKCLLPATLQNTPILLSGGADASIIIWDLSSSNYGKQLHKLKGHTKALQHLAIDPLSLPSEPGSPIESFIVFSASSDREIRRWHISLSSAHELSDSDAGPILAHETSIYTLHFTPTPDADLWTASADKTAKHLVRDRAWESDTILPHPDFVRDILPFDDLGLVVTACRDEEVRVWEISSGQLVCTYSGHYEEITELCRVVGRSTEVVSVSIDGTVRRWGLGRGEMAKYLEDLAKGEEAGDGEEKEGMLTAEEEAELAELLEDDD